MTETNDLAIVNYDEIRALHSKFPPKSEPCECTCAFGLNIKAELAKLPNEQIKGVAIGLALGMAYVFPLKEIGGATAEFARHVGHNLVNAQRACVDLVGSDQDTYNDFDLPL